MKKLASITIRVTQERKEFLTHRGKIHGMTLSEYIRVLLPQVKEL